MNEYSTKNTLVFLKSTTFYILSLGRPKLKWAKRRENMMQHVKNAGHCDPHSRHSLSYCASMMYDWNTIKPMIVVKYQCWKQLVSNYAEVHWNSMIGNVFSTKKCCISMWCIDTQHHRCISTRLLGNNEEIILLQY